MVVDDVRIQLLDYFLFCWLHGQLGIPVGGMPSTNLSPSAEGGINPAVANWHLLLT